MKFFRKLHLYLGCFFAPLLLFFTATGWYQTVRVHRNKTVGEAESGGWVEKMTSIHVDQVFPLETADAFDPALFQYLVVAMSIALILTVLLGVFLAFKMTRSKGWIAMVLLAGTALPIVFLWLGNLRE
ncbi:hypothetical protein OAE97_02475 [Verrucomicrobia bacterium]|nr:hypothetical protein [Verrucomicrobiota bacterium]MDB4665188.1 hypothetical protein [Verrucomicrobiota bacterium]MDG1890909.1 hypothetical protein [Verrucomicrobiota bacterium]